MKNYKGFLLLAIFLINFIVSCKNEPKNSSADANTSSGLENLNKSIEQNPENSELYYQRALFYFNTRKMEQSIKDLEHAILLLPDSSKYYLLLSDIYFSTVQTRKSKETLEKCLLKDKNNIEANLKLAELYLYVSEHEKSISYADNVLKNNKYHPKAYFLKGMNFKEMKDTGKAISNFQTVVEQDPEYYNAYMQLGILYGLKRNPLALQYLNTALKLNPQSTEALYARAMFYQEQNQIKKAIADYDEILKVDPSYANAYYNKGYISLLHQRELTEAIKYFSLAIKANPNYAEAYYMRGKCYEEKKDMGNAKKDYNTALQINPDFELAKLVLNQDLN